MHHDLHQKFRQELSSGEALLWSGRPPQGIILRGSDFFLIPFSILWGGFAIFWEYSAFNSGAPTFFLLFGAPFVLIGIYLIVGRFIYDSLNRRNTFYGISDDRVILITEFPARRVKSLNLSTLTDVSLSEKSDGGGKIVFGPEQPMGSWANGMAWPGMTQYQSPMFELVKDAKHVYETVRNAQKNSE